MGKIYVHIESEFLLRLDESYHPSYYTDRHFTEAQKRMFGGNLGGDPGQRFSRCGSPCSGSGKVKKLGRDACSQASPTAAESAALGWGP